jgi:hypothetical protein
VLTGLVADLIVDCGVAELELLAHILNSIILEGSAVDYTVG